jgi:cytochrome c5
LILGWLALSGAGCQKAPATLDTPLKVYETYCFACHKSGAAGAPRLNDAERWQILLASGEDKLIENTIKGIRAMPPRGSCADCSDDQLAETVRWMLSQNSLR